MPSPSQVFYPYSRYLTELFGERAYKIVVASGLTCPTRDGTLAKRGCAFCDVRGSSSFFGKQGRGREVAEQIANRLPGVRKRYSANAFLAYFQSYTNTYADVDYLREIYTAALSSPGIRGLCVGTRPDCLPDPVLGLLEELAQEHYVSLELGVQSFHDPTLEWLERGHDRACSLDALSRLARFAPHVHVCVHLIFGSPTESEDAPREAAELLNTSGCKGVKLHQLMVLEHTELARRYRESPFATLTLDEYATRVADFLENLDPSIYVERLCAKASHRDECLAPEWSKDQWHPHNRLRELFAARGMRQGSSLDSRS